MCPDCGSSLNVIGESSLWECYNCGYRGWPDGWGSGRTDQEIQRAIYLRGKSDNAKDG